MSYAIVAAVGAVVAAAAAAVTATISAVALWVQGQRWRVALQTDLLLKLTEKFYDARMRGVRRVAATKLLQGDSSEFEDVYQLLDFFIVIGTLLEKKALSMDLTYRMFEYWIVRYWHCAADRVRELRTTHNDPELGITLERLAVKMEEYRAKRGLPPLSYDDAHSFLVAEAREQDGELPIRAAELPKRAQSDKPVQRRADRRR